MLDRSITPEDAANLIMDGDTLVVGGNGGTGVPESILEAIEKRSIDCQPYEKEGLLAGKRRNEYYQGLKDNLDHLGSSSTGQTVCTTQRIGTSGMAKTTCREQ